jgi:hypothetical protein
MNLDEALAVYLYLQNARPADRDRDPGWRDACDVVAREANKVLEKYEDRPQYDD